jgi:hypothetical protein
VLASYLPDEYQDLQHSSRSAGSGGSGRRTRGSMSHRSADSTSCSPLKPTDRTEYLLLGTSPVKLENMNRDKVWSPTGHESRLALNRRAGDILQDVLTDSQKHSVRKQQSQYYNGVMAVAPTVPKKMTSGSAKTVVNKSGGPRKAANNGRRTVSATGRPRASTSHQFMAPAVTGSVPRSRPRSVSPTTSRLNNISRVVAPRRGSASKPEAPDVIKNSKKRKQGTLHDAQRRRSSTTTATTLSSGGATDYKQEALADANAEIARTVGLLTQSIENVSCRLISVCEEFTSSMHQMAANMTNIYETQSQSILSRSLDLSGAGTTFSTPLMPNKTSQVGSSSRHSIEKAQSAGQSASGKIYTEALNSEHLNGHAGTSTWHPAMSIYDSEAGGTSRNGQEKSYLQDSLDSETVENAVRASLRNKLLKMYE